MMGNTHIIIGLSYGVSLIPAVTQNEYTPEQLGFIMCGLVVGSLLPDIDHPHSLISQKIPLVGKTISKLTTHRGLFHSIVGVGMMFVLWSCLSVIVADGLTSVGIQQADNATRYIASGLMAGYILHIIADMLTISGVKLFYPLKGNIKIPLFETGGTREWLLSVFLIAVSAIQVISVTLN
jgi:inner membrane protein